ncbi:MAG TPA: ATP-dependent zinc metalloprotease FtsH [Planctomycetota bacterium]|nr:ATP-dependent zinc metalloprotease FtsH [Planctomycetota bacterium]
MFNQNDDGERDTDQKRRPSRSPLIWIIVAIVILFVWLAPKSLSGGPEKASLREINEHIEKGRVKKILLTDDTITLVLRDGAEAKEVRKTSKISKDPHLKFYTDWANTLAVEGKIDDFDYDSKSKWLETVTYWLAPSIIFFVLIYFLFIRQMRQAGGGGVLSFGKSRAKLTSKEHTHVTFEDVAGIEEAKAECREIIEFLRNPKKFQRLGGRMPRGILLVGAPGTGKTLLAKAIAGEADVPFFSISGSDFVEMFVGVGASRVRDLFQKAKANSPCIIFLDEIDAVGRRRGHGWGGGHDEREQTLNAILVEMDGFDTNEKVVVLAATNRPDVLDLALLRPGRFDRQIMVDLPDVKGREEILEVHARKVNLSPAVDLSLLARGTPLFSGADLEAIINESAILAVLKNKDAIEQDDLEESRDKVRWGRQKTSRVMDEKDKRVIAHHEAGHALVAKLLPEVEPLHRVTIIPRGPALGATMQLPEKDRYIMPRQTILGTIKMLFAGRVSEAMLCDDISSGAQDDIKRATDLINKMVREWGMSDRIGPISFADSEEKLYGGEVVLSKSYSEATSVEIDKEVARIARECYAEAERLLTENREGLRAIAEGLLKYEVLDASDVDEILAGREPSAAAERARRNHTAARTTPSPGKPETEDQKHDLPATGELGHDMA